MIKLGQVLNFLKIMINILSGTILGLLVTVIIFELVQVLMGKEFMKTKCAIIGWFLTFWVTITSGMLVSADVMDYCISMSPKIYSKIVDMIYNKYTLRNMNFCGNCTPQDHMDRFIGSLNDGIIWKNHHSVKTYTGYNMGCNEITSCGVTSQAIFNLMLTIQGDLISDATFMLIGTSHIRDFNQLLDHNIIFIGMSSCKCCDFPGHAFVIVCYDDLCVIIQSFFGIYHYNEQIGYIPKDTMREYLTRMQTMYGMSDKKMNPQVINDLSSLTHVDLSQYNKCRLKESDMTLYYIEKKKSVTCRCL